MNLSERIIAAGSGSARIPRGAQKPALDDRACVGQGGGARASIPLTGWSCEEFACEIRAGVAASSGALSDGVFAEVEL